MKDKKILLVMTCGTTSEPIIKDIDEHVREKENIQVILWYGRGLEGQEETPFDAASEVQELCRKLNIQIKPKEIRDPENFDICLQEFEKFFSEEVNPDDLESLVINFTGGTKSMSAAIVHSALKKYKGSNLTLRYIGGRRGKNGRVTDEMTSQTFNTIIGENEDRTIEMIKGYHYSEAKEFLEGIEPYGIAVFLIPAVNFLEQIDNFNYKEAIKYTKELNPFIPVFTPNDKTKSISKTIEKLLESTKKLNSLLTELDRIKREKEFTGEHEILNNFYLLIADIYENAKRKLKTGDYPGSVLRCYRAIEASAQYWEYKWGIYPGDEMWRVKIPESYKSNIESLSKQGKITITIPGKLSFMSGLVFVFGVIKGKDKFPEEFIKKIRAIQQARNESFLEHGFVVVDRASAEGVIKDSGDCICEILGISQEKFEEYLKEVRHEWE